MDEELSLVLVGKLLAEKGYRVERKVNEGTYGEVYQVVHTTTHQQAALKLIELTRIHKLGRMHEVTTQIGLLQRLRHPGVIRLIEVLKWQGHVGIVMELGSFGDLFSLIGLLHSRVEMQSRVTRLMSFYLGQALEVMDYLHSQGVVHRDIKPENFVLGADLRLRLIDFGTALLSSECSLFSSAELLTLSPPSSLQHVDLVGSANYLSPESLQLRYSPKSDVWAFGVLAYKFYFNALPFQGGNNLEIFQQVSEGEIELSKADHSVEELIVLCLKRDPCQRATAKMLKMCSLFKGVNFKEIFELNPPLSRQELEASGELEFLFERTVEKQMFFGNFKPRLLTIAVGEKGLLMAYRYVPSKQVKHQFELGLNDYVQAVGEREFRVVTRDGKFLFRVEEGQSAEETALQVNSLIRKHYDLQ